MWVAGNAWIPLQFLKILWVPFTLDTSWGGIWTLITFVTQGTGRVAPCVPLLLEGLGIKNKSAVCRSSLLRGDVLPPSAKNTADVKETVTIHPSQAPPCSLSQCTDQNTVIGSQNSRRGWLRTWCLPSLHSADTRKGQRTKKMRRYKNIRTAQCLYSNLGDLRLGNTVCAQLCQEMVHSFPSAKFYQMEKKKQQKPPPPDFLIQLHTCIIMSCLYCTGTAPQ